jgi:hypothetical protein
MRNKLLGTEYNNLTLKWNDVVWILSLLMILHIIFTSPTWSYQTLIPIKVISSTCSKLPVQFLNVDSNNSSCSCIGK